MSLPKKRHKEIMSMAKKLRTMLPRTAPLYLAIVFVSLFLVGSSTSEDNLQQQQPQPFGGEFFISLQQSNSDLSNDNSISAANDNNTNNNQNSRQLTTGSSRGFTRAKRRRFGDDTLESGNAQRAPAFLKTDRLFGKTSEQGFVPSQRTTTSSPGLSAITNAIPAASPNFEAAFQGECNQNNETGSTNPCEHICLDLHDGTYECSCFYGFTLAVDGYSCAKLPQVAPELPKPPSAGEASEFFSSSSGVGTPASTWPARPDAAELVHHQAVTLSRASGGEKFRAEKGADEQAQQQHHHAKEHLRGGRQPRPPRRKLSDSTKRAEPDNDKKILSREQQQQLELGLEQEQAETHSRHGNLLAAGSSEAHDGLASGPAPKVAPSSLEDGAWELGEPEMTEEFTRSNLSPPEASATRRRLELEEEQEEEQEEEHDDSRRSLANRLQSRKLQTQGASEDRNKATMKKEWPWYELQDSSVVVLGGQDETEWRRTERQKQQKRQQQQQQKQQALTGAALDEEMEASAAGALTKEEQTRRRTTPIAAREAEPDPSVKSIMLANDRLAGQLERDITLSGGGGGGGGTMMDGQADPSPPSQTAAARLDYDLSLLGQLVDRTILTRLGSGQEEEEERQGAADSEERRVDEMGPNRSSSPRRQQPKTTTTRVARDAIARNTPRDEGPDNDSGEAEIKDQAQSGRLVVVSAQGPEQDQNQNQDDLAAAEADEDDEDQSQ